MLLTYPIQMSPDFRQLCSFTLPTFLRGETSGVAGERYAMSESVDEAPEQSFYHESILLDEVVQSLAPEEGRLFVDGTLGGGGHTEALLKAGATVKGIDRDVDARTYAGERLARFGDRFEAIAGCYGDMSRLADEGEWGELDGILLDLGVSSHQLDVGERGFSFRFDGPLDMRMGNEGRTAADLVNTWDEAELRQIFWDLGEEKSARKISAWIVQEREKAPFETTLQLADGIEKLIGRRGRTHPATKVFQALRMEVNDELGELRRFLEIAPDLLKPGGRLAVMTFHSLEDRIVKQSFRDRSKAEIDRPEWPAPRPNPDHVYRLLTRKGIAPGGEEISRNARSRSSRLRVVERITNPTA